MKETTDNLKSYSKSSAGNDRAHKVDMAVDPNMLAMLIEKKCNYYKLEPRNMQEIMSLLSSAYNDYIRNILDNLVKLSRIRNVNFNTYFKPEIEVPELTIHSYNINKTPKGLVPVHHTDTNLIFTKNMRNVLNEVEYIEDLLNCKMKYERFSHLRDKIEEETTQAKEKEKVVISKQNVNKPPKIRKRRETQLVKMAKNAIANTKQQEEISQHNKERIHTLEYFLEDKPKLRVNIVLTNKEPVSYRESMIEGDAGSNIMDTNAIETLTKGSDITKEMVFNNEVNELNLNIYKNQALIEQPRFSIPKRRINLKDLIAYLEKNRITSGHSLILHKALIKLNS